MLELTSTQGKPPAAYLVGIRRQGMIAGEADEHLDELEQLVTTFGLPTVGREVVVLREPTAAFLTGSGKADDIEKIARGLEADVIIFDDELSPTQQRNWERQTNLAVIDRTEVILGIFADRAQTKEARLQVELARAEYSLPRLARAWTHLERQRGGSGARGGAGEAQIEVDRRLLRDRIVSLKRELKHVRRVRATQRKSRSEIPLPSAAIVGYTNAGKSSLLNAMTGAGVLEEDKLFATLDPTTRKFTLPNSQTILLSDTVGFVRKLPHTLVDAFKATLEEAQLATLLIHVVDANHPNALAHRTATEDVLRELGSVDKPTVLLLNKIDLVEERASLGPLMDGYRLVVPTSTTTGEGLESLSKILAELAGHDLMQVQLRVPTSRGDIVSLLHREGHVQSQSYEDEIAVIEATIPRRVFPRLKEFIM